MNMTLIGIKLKFTAYIVLAVLFINVTGINAGTLGGFRGKVMKKIGKSRHKIVHMIEVKATYQSEVSTFRLNSKLTQTAKSLE